jgi:alkanesulfonate monooxygenase SsuD/methylene tetrahydromethanopterin reductase-like flavin-dependent oxidoreductase (luciferase family)
LALAERADTLGLHSLWLPESHFQRGATPAPLVALGAVAARTRRLRLATTSLLLPLHHPLRVAAETATLDALSGGRLLLGLGRGFRAPVFDGFEVDAATKRDRFDEALDALLAAWSGEPVALAGAHFPARGGARVRVGLRPLQRPHPPLVVAAFGRKGLLQAARRGLPYLASPLETLATLEENYALWREHAARADGAGPRQPVMRTLFVARDDAEARAVRGALAQEARGLAAATPRALASRAAGPLAERVLVGTAGEVRDGSARYRERLGMDLLIARIEVPGVPPAARDASLERLAELVGAPRPPGYCT